MAKIYTVTLTKEERFALEQILSKGRHRSQTYRAAYVLINVDEGPDGEKVTNVEICKVAEDWDAYD